MLAFQGLAHLSPTLGVLLGCVLGAHLPKSTPTKAARCYFLPVHFLLYGNGTSFGLFLQEVGERRQDCCIGLNCQPSTKASQLFCIDEKVGAVLAHLLRHSRAAGWKPLFDMRFNAWLSIFCLFAQSPRFFIEALIERC
jgi:hypothetical protein